MGFFRQEYWSGLPFPSPGGLPVPRTDPESLAFPALAGRFFTTVLLKKPKDSSVYVCVCLYVSHSVMSDSMRPPCTIACQAPLSMEFSRQEYWSELPCPFPGDLPDPEIAPGIPALQANSLPSEPLRKPIKIAICRIKRTRV